MSLEMYQQNILDHAKHPRNSGALEGATNTAHKANPLCGDEVDFQLLIDGADKVVDVKFTGRGCTVSQAAASMLSEKLKGMSRDEVARLTAEDMTGILGVPINPSRMTCATLGLQAVQTALVGPP